MSITTVTFMTPGTRVRVRRRRQGRKALEVQRKCLSIISYAAPSYFPYETPSYKSRYLADVVDERDERLDHHEHAPLFNGYP
jgi:hypothetical protein